MKKQQQVKVDLDKAHSTHVILDPTEYYNNFKLDKGVKFNESPHPHTDQVTIVDAVLACRGFGQDKIYEDFVYYRNNIRRGNSILKIGKDVFWLRKGLRKFFDIRLQNLNGLKGGAAHYATFREIENVLTSKDLVGEQDQPICHVWKLLKANGENCQVSYCKELESWSVSSKNVSLLVKNAKGLADYKEDRYFFAKEIALCFFKIVQNNKYTPQQLEGLKNYLSNRTMVGEYCGNPSHQHIVKYEQQTILFYAVIDHKSGDTCIPPPQAGEFFKNYNLPTTNDFDKALIGKYKDFTELTQSLSKVFQQVAQSKLDSDQEGCVLYLGLEITEGFYKEALSCKMGDKFHIPEEFGPVTLRVSSLAKLKTLEYRLLRKLREKLKGCVNSKNLGMDKKQLRAVFGKFVNESKTLIGKSQLKTPFQYYQLLALVALDYVNDNSGLPAAFTLMTSAYIDFLNIIMYSVEKNTKPTVQMMNDGELINKLRAHPWSEFNINVLEQYEKAMESFYPEYKKIMQLQEQEKKESSSSHEDKDDDRE